MTRAGNVPLVRFAATNPHVVATALGQYAGLDPKAPEAPEAPEDPKTPQIPADITSWVLDQPLRSGSMRFPHRASTSGPAGLALDTISDVVSDPWGPAGDAIVARARDARQSGAGGFRFAGPADRPSVLTRMDLAERVRTEVGGLIVVDGPTELRDDLAAGLVSGRADLICLTGKEAA
jgi:anthraniloyl-CoA monooxygenase